jgi:erythromycin esterase-like protein
LEALSGFQRFPTWMWRNEIVKSFIEWLRDYNSALENSHKIGFYGLDLYSLNKSTEIIINYLDKIDKTAADRARERYSCFYGFKSELAKYGYALSLGLAPSCKNAVVEQLIELNANAFKYLQKGILKEDELFYIEQNARLVKAAEQYYRSMFSDEISSWNVRDDHMADTLYLLVNYISKVKSCTAKIVVWAHNSHIGDARATEKGKGYNEINLGQRVKERSGNKSFLLGFMTNKGTVTAASNWDGVVERKNLRPALRGSYEHYFKHLGKDFIINLRDHNLKAIIPETMLERAVGVLYRPKTEFISHYFEADLLKQFDGLIYLNETKALTPLEITALWHKGEVYETFPSGL